jgi:mono/diheme cytochrome c family protein
MLIRFVVRALVVALAFVGLFATALAVWLISAGTSARPTPGRIETVAARRLRSVAIPSHVRNRVNPVPLSDELIAGARAHFADHCASCHANDGSGRTTIGQGLYPRVPDMRTAETQSLSDGELFYIIEHGVRLTGMPAWGNDTPESETAGWQLVHFIRHLPKLTPEEIAEMESLNPKSPAEIREQMEEEEFLKGGERPPASPASPNHHGGHP